MVSSKVIPLVPIYFSFMIEISDEMLQLACPVIGVKIGTKWIHAKYSIDDLSIMTSNINDLQRIINIIVFFCESFGFKCNINKTEICMFNKKGANIPNIQIRYLGVLIKIVDAIKYLGLIFSGIQTNSGVYLFPNGSGLGLSRCLGPGECLHSFIHSFRQILLTLRI